MNQRIRLRDTQIGHQHSRLHIHRLLLKFLPASLRVLVKHHIAIPVCAHLRNGHTEIGNLQKEQLRLLCNRIQVRRAHQPMIDREDAASRHQIDHVYKQVAGNPHQNVRFIQRSQLLRLADRIQHDRFIPPNLRFKPLLRTYRHLLLEKLMQLVHVADASRAVLLVSSVRDVQNHRRCGRWELLVEVIIAVRRQANRIRLIEIEMDRALVCVTDQRGDRLILKRSRGNDEFAEAGEAGGEVGAVEQIEGVSGGIEGLQNGEIFVGVRVFGLAEKRQQRVEELRLREARGGTAG